MSDEVRVENLSQLSVNIIVLVWDLTNVSDLQKINQIWIITENESHTYYICIQCILTSNHHILKCLLLEKPI